MSCGSDAEDRYAGLSKQELRSDAVSYRLRYRAPPWEKLPGDALITGTRKAVNVGASLRNIVPNTATVLVIKRESSIESLSELAYVKYRLDVAALNCEATELSDGQTCAEHLAALDYAGRIKSEDGGFFGAEPRHTENDAGQPFHEFMTRGSNPQRYYRLAYFDTGNQQTAVRLYIEGNPRLDEAEVTNMIKAFELLEEAP